VLTDILQPTHLLVILVVALLVLGPKRLPEVGRSLGRGLRDFKDALNTSDDAPPEPPPVISTAAAQAPEPAPHDPVHPAG
jgi:sec-independent protein translocase protein TatA